MTLTPERLNELMADSTSPGDVGKLYRQMLQQIINHSLNAKIEVRHVRVWLDDRADRPEAANGLL